MKWPRDNQGTMAAAGSGAEGGSGTGGAGGRGRPYSGEEWTGEGKARVRGMRFRYAE